MSRPHVPPLPIATRTLLAEKQRELAHFVELQHMSAELVAELELLETRLGNLANGTEKVAVVLQNWGNIARALTLASSTLVRVRLDGDDNEFAGDENPEDGFDAPQQ